MNLLTHSISKLAAPAQEAGATPTLELAFTLADGLEYIRCAQEAGLHVDQVGMKERSAGARAGLVFLSCVTFAECAHRDSISCG